MFNAAEERLELCVDTAGHFPVGPDVEELVQEALSQLRSDAASHSREGSPVHGLRLGAGGAVRRKEQTVTAFQGKGHSLGSAPPEHPPIRRQHSSGVDLSNSARGEEITLSGEELVRVAPGMVTLREGRGLGLEPAVIEAQRQRLQEMVSNIQASMDKHLRQQAAARHDVKEEEASDKQEDMESHGAQPPTTFEPMDQSWYFITDIAEWASWHNTHIHTHCDSEITNNGAGEFETHSLNILKILKWEIWSDYYRNWVSAFIQPNITMVRTDLKRQFN